jgi:glycosyltransferase involved in cell wall biosynthesis
MSATKTGATRPQLATSFSNSIWCVDSPGWGGSEKDLIRVFEMAEVQPKAVICGEAITAELERFFMNRQIRLIRQHSLNSWRYAITGLWRATSLVIEFPQSVFYIWAHHHDSNRWLQLVLAIFRRRFLLVERLVTSDRADFASSRLSIPIKRFVAPRARAIVLNAHSQVEHYRQLFRLGRVSIVVIPNSRPIDAIHERVVQLRINRPALRLSLQLSDRPTVLCVGRLTNQKDQATLIRAMGELSSQPQAQLVLVGDGPDRTELERLALELTPDRVTFTGQQSDPLPWLAAADVFVMPSTAEGLPGALIEAMAAELPCIATDIPGNRELIKHRQTGLLVPVNDPIKLSKALEEMFVSRPAAARMARAGYEWVLSGYDESKEEADWRRLLGQQEPDSIVAGKSRQ